MKLRFWPTGISAAEGQIFDLDWSWIKALKGRRIGELRINDTIGGCDNLRIIFFAPAIPTKPLPTIWVLAVFQKKRDEFTKAQIMNFKYRSLLILERFYKNP